MKINTKQLIKELQWANRFAERKNTIPILANVLFDADGGKLSLSATNLEVAGTTSVIGSGGDKWAVAVPVAKLIQYLGKVDEEEVELSTPGNNWLIVKHSGDGTKVSGMSKESYPELPVPKSKQSVTLRNLPQAIERTLFAISPEESRFTLNGALLEVNGDGAHLIATDGHRLSKAPVTAARANMQVHAILDRKLMQEAQKLDAECCFQQDDDHVFLTYSGMGYADTTRRIIARKLKGTFPDHERVVPKEMPNHFMIPVASTKKVLDRVALYADERSHAVVFRFTEGSLTMSARSLEEGEAHGSVAVRPGEIATSLPFEVGLNANYALDFLNRVDSSMVAFCFASDKPDEVNEAGEVVHKGSKGGSKAVVLTNQSGWLVVLMPMRI